MMRRFIFLLAFISAFFSLKATHLVGGEMTYVRLSGNTIRVTLTVYRDDYNGNPNALLDNPAVISFFNQNGQFLEAIDITLDLDTLFQQDLNPCQDAIPNVRTETGVYIFDINLNTISGFNPNMATFMVYGRCCRNNIINNLFNSGDQGFSSVARIPPMSTNNGSPVFNDFQQYLCAGRVNTLDFSATDPNGDSLYYSLCDPFLGLDNNVPAANSNDLNFGGVVYNNYGSPFNTVNWASGYNAGNPFGGPIFLDPNTGIMQVTPSSQGVFVMGVCVSEYRNGIYLGTVLRDFQYLISACDFPEIIVDFNTSLGVDPATGFNIISAKCNEALVNFDASNSINVLSFSWDFGVPGITTDVGTGPTPSYFYSDTGSFVVTVSGTTSTGCIATSDSFLVLVYPIFEPGYSFVDSCLNQSVQFTDLTISTSSAIDSWSWNFGDPSTNLDVSTQQNPSYTYGQAGTFNSYLIVTTDKGCVDTAFQQVTIHPLPIPNYTPSNPLCEGSSFTLSNNSTIQSGSIQSYSWLIDGNVLSTTNANYNFTSAGVYPIQLIAVSALGCTDTLVQNITINPLPNLLTSPDDSICPNTTALLSASGANTYSWSPASLLNTPNAANTATSVLLNDTSFIVTGTNNFGCSKSDTVNIYLLELPNAYAGEDTSVCLNAANVLSFNTSVPLQGSGGISYQWSPSQGLSSTNTANTVATPTSNTTYVLTVTDANNCVNQDSVNVYVLNPALELISVEVDSMCLGDTVYVDVLDQGNVSTYSWSPAIFLTDANVREPGFYPPSNRSYVITVTNYCYQDMDTVSIEVIPTPTLDAGPLDSICFGDPAYTLNASPTNLDFYQWTSLDLSLSDPSIPNPSVQPTASTWYYLLGVDTVGSLACSANDSVNILVYNNPDLTLLFPFNYPGYICFGDSVGLEAVSFDGIDFQWSANNGALIITPNAASTSVVPTDTSIFYQLVTNTHGCTTEDSMQVNVQLPVQASILGDTVMCFGDFVNLEAFGGLYYQWSPDSIFSNANFPSTQASPDSSITVMVEVSNDCFSDSAYHFIQVNQLPVADAGPDLFIYRDESDFLLGSGTGEPLWYTEDKTFDGLLDVPLIFDPEVSPFNTTNYVLEVTDPLTACVNYDTARVNVEVLTLLAFPTGFSPNANGTNDFARIIKYLNIEKLIYLSIYDRWGEEIFRTDQLDGAWDGTFKGRSCEIGTYAWVIRALTKDQETITRSGNITLIR
ncbi:MAG: gliding motility-associated C-terminal domain-containing protein [Chitinophagales bacterium]|nr:gliding motility-associated C-terminal domain-containing protein [Chitinophagales bacterium]